MTRKLTEQEADAAFLAADFTPIEPYIDSGTRRACICNRCGTSCAVTYTSVRLGQRGCKTCKGQTIGAMKRKPDSVADQAFLDAGATPLEPYQGTGTPRRCRCNTCGAECSPRLADLQRGHGPCKACGYQTVSSKLQDLKLDLALIEARYAAAGVTPLEPWQNSNTRRLCKCNACGRTIKVLYNVVFKGGTACRKCAAQARGKRQLLQTDIVEAIFANADIDLLEPYRGVSVRHLCHCNRCNTQVRLSIQAMRRNGCSNCSQRRKAAARTLPQHVADAVFYAADLTPLEPYEASTKPRRCRCNKCGREVRPTHNSLKNGQGGCKYCAPTGLDRTAPGVIYLVRNDAYMALKIGVTSTAARKDRIRSHQQNGWATVQTWDTADGATAELIETVILRWWRNTIGAPAALTKADMPQAGHSETVSMLYVTSEETIERVDGVLAELLSTFGN